MRKYVIEAVIGLSLIGGLVAFAVSQRRANEQRIAAERAQPAAPVPLQDWKKFFDAVHEDDIEISWHCKSEIEGNAVHLFLVDGNRWYEVQRASLMGCGGKQDEYGYITGAGRLRRELHKVPGPEAKFVIVGPGNPVLLSVEVRYPKDKQ